MKKKIESKRVELVCETCGENNFIIHENDRHECNVCHRNYTKEELLDLNNENIQAHVNDIKNEITDQFSQQLKKAFKKWK
ncbi:hypothetical protein [Acinetobacter bereziniae]|uniref:hypothetical protein n=1 Tax=Acinetobacter bereziniae TaxID=106648 RepID=UPI00125039CB|nr:hypothetical protein [Acinetobacter bereziniae]MBJ8452870.1 hypothetical protein [Acinetobacter bereziniae]MBJ8457580.1 hypothetical protein [Acinetobacter bereziniae]